jgi:hypothetical protein
MKDAARLVYTVAPMTSDEAKQFGISEGERRSLIRMDSAKVNIAPPSSDAKWFRLIGVPLENGNELYPKGDNIQTIEIWKPPKTWDGLDSALLNRVLDEIDHGMENGQRYSVANAATDRAAWKVVQRHAPAKTEKQCKEIVTVWVKNGLLVQEDYDDPVARKERRGVRIDATKRPS